MKQFLPLMLLSLLISCGNQAPNLENSELISSSIVNGETQPLFRDNFPSVVGLKMGGGYCSGNLISEDRIATAAHCIFSLPSTKQGKIEQFRNIYNYMKNANPDTDFDSMTKTEFRASFTEALREIALQRARSIKVHVGKGKKNFGYETQYEVSTVLDVPRRYLRNQAQIILANTTAAIPADAIVAERQSVGRYTFADQTILKLSEPVRNARPVPFITQLELDEINDDLTEVIVVGLGRSFDPRLEQSNRLLIKSYDQMIVDAQNEAVRNDQDRLTILPQLRQEQGDLIRLGEAFDRASENSGMKQSVVLEIERFDRIGLLLRRMTDDIEGACFGDSGGAGFVRLKDGSLRQIGVTSAITGICGAGKAMLSVTIGD